ncbi:MAG: glycerophosphodiester phosphodiesterase family protein [Hyphomicrobiaceae bacterium]
MEQFFHCLGAARSSRRPGLAPENTLPAFAKALSLGVDCLELDVGMSKDAKLVVAHDPLLNPDLVRSAGVWISTRTPQGPDRG